MSVEIRVDEKRLSGLASELGTVYNRLSRVKEELGRLNKEMNENWSDKEVDVFNQKYEKGMDSIWDLLVAISNIETFFEEAAKEYLETDKAVMSM